jgi:eukaryotic-like serine/threonine-protein kinase
VIETPFGDKYRIFETLPAGEALEAYRAVTAAGETVVVKVVAPRDVDAFLRQAKRATEVVNPHVVRVLEATELGGRCYVVYEASEGMDLASVLATEGSREPGVVAGWGTDVADGLAAIHAAGLVHGRVRPSTLLRSPRGVVKILDLGLTGALPPADLTAEAPPAEAFYVTPEEVLGRPLVPASDLYALGVVLYELVTARLPVGGSNAFDVAMHHAQGQIEPPSRLDPAVTPELENVIVRALSKAPEDRCETARQMQRDLARAAAGAPVAPPRTSVAAPRRRPLWPWIAGGALVVVVALVVLWATGVLGGGGSEVPNVVGLRLSDATSRLTDAGFTVGKVTYQPADSSSSPSTSPTAPGTVLAQTPAAGTQADEKSAVDLVVAGTAGATVPDLVGMQQAEAAATLAAAGFTLGTVTQVPSADVPAGSVVSQSPAAGTQASTGATVTISVSSGGTASGSPTPIVTPSPTDSTIITPSVSPSTIVTPTGGTGAQGIPDVTGMTEAEATSTLTAAGCAVQVRRESNAVVASGTVIMQQPGPGTVVSAGSPVLIVVSSGPTKTPTGK